MNALDVLSWLDTERPFIDAYQDPPNTLEELQQATTNPKTGYNIHHIVEQTAARKSGFSEDLIDGRENLVRIPALKHWEISGWYGKPNKDFDGRSPREYLQDKDWEERRQIGLYALKKFGVLKQ